MTDVEKVLIVPDTHAPYHDKRAWALMIQAAQAFKPDVVVHMGDLADMYTVSSHSKDPSRALSLKEELLGVRALRAELDALKPKRKVFVEGNHEDRLRRYLQDKAPELFGLVSADELLELSKNGWEFVPYRDYAKVGRVHFTHDTGHSGKYTTARALETFQSSVVIGHHHAIGYLVNGDAKGKHQVAAQFGWLGDFRKIDYMQKVKAQRNWSLGFGIGYHDTTNGTVFLSPCPIVNYACCLEGVIYRG